MPSVSVVIPVYNCGKYIKTALESILAQSDSDYEIIVVDDCSSDSFYQELLELANAYANVRIVRHDENMGVAKARNTGVHEASGKWIAFLDGDDAWKPDKLEKQMQALEQTGYSLCYSGACLVDDDGAGLGQTIRVPEEVDYEELLKGNVIVCSSVVARRDLLLSFPMERSDLHEDYITWLRILQANGRACGVDEPLVIYRLAKGSKSRNKMKSALMVWRTFRFLGFTPNKTMLYFIYYALHGVKRYYSKSRPDSASTDLGY